MSSIGKKFRIIELMEFREELAEDIVHLDDVEEKELHLIEIRKVEYKISLLMDE